MNGCTDQASSLVAGHRLAGAAPHRNVLILLTLILVFNSVDRLALGIVLQDIKLEFRLSDTQLGLMSGIAFSIFYSLMGIPIARWADRGDRGAIISITAALGSAAVALCGLAGSFVQLLLIRIGVAVGEAGCVPPAHSLIADLYARAERARAIGLFMLGGPLSAIIGYMFAGWLNETFGWRIMFGALGIMGLSLVPIAYLTLPEPRTLGRRTLAGAIAPARQGWQSAADRPAFMILCRTLWRNRTFRHLLFSYAVVSFFANGIGQWQATFLLRSYHLGTTELGALMTLAIGGGGLVGTYLGGHLASRYAARNERFQLRAIAAVYALFSLGSLLIYSGLGKYTVIALLALCTIGSSIGSAPKFAMIQSLVPARMRAIALVLILFLANLIGTGLAPLAVGLLSDAIQATAGAQSLRYALMALCPGYLWGAWHLLMASRTVAADLARVEDAA